jgi:hypothetical protein
MSKYINGPVNIIRLEGSINGVKKILYVFMDRHYSLNQQTKCPDYNADDIVKYINRELESVDKDIDFFMEFRPKGDLTYHLRRDAYRDIYIFELEKFFYKNFKNNNIKNVRFHYADIRDVFYDQEEQDLYYVIADAIAKKTISPANIKKIDKFLLRQKMYYLAIYHILTGESTNVKLKYEKELYKIYNKYKHKDVEINSRILINLYCKMTNMIMKKNDELRAIINKDDVKMLKKFTKKYSQYFVNKLSLHSSVMDIYFLRRFCDKDYITNAIFYGGTAHGSLYVRFLLKYYDFNITHVANSKNSLNLDEINKQIKNEELYDNTLDTILYMFDMNIQCSNVSNLPEHFS